MFYAKNTYMGIPSSYTSGQSTKVISTEPEKSGSDDEGLDNFGRTHSNFTIYKPSPHMINVDIYAKGELEFLELPHGRPVHASSSLNVGDLQVGMEFSSKDAVTLGHPN
ncbi:hypothetical protein J1N35_044650 [Gossypium stocksii]|uniref:Uncharacterized protein n=1 Tax=Gossypium stocksii TaxID=47602 RepID=A0A9D3U9X6_9ROSI|nr:hypothetical protein J1N35_044650 [Gossypium stocksii]